MQIKNTTYKKTALAVWKRHELKRMLAIFLSVSMTIGGNTVILADVEGGAANSQNSSGALDNALLDGSNLNTENNNESGEIQKGEGETQEGEGETQEGEGETQKGEGETQKGEGENQEGESETQKGEGGIQKGESNGIINGAAVHVITAFLPLEQDTTVVPVGTTDEEIISVYLPKTLKAEGEGGAELDIPVNWARNAVQDGMEGDGATTIRFAPEWDKEQYPAAEGITAPEITVMEQFYAVFGLEKAGGPMPENCRISSLKLTINEVEYEVTGNYENSEAAVQLITTDEIADGTKISNVNALFNSNPAAQVLRFEHIDDGFANGVTTIKVTVAEAANSMAVFDYTITVTAEHPDIKDKGLDLTGGLPAKKSVYKAKDGSVTIMPDVLEDGRREIVVENATIANGNLNGNCIALPADTDIKLTFRGDNALLANSGGTAIGQTGGSLKIFVEQASKTKVIAQNSAAGIVSPNVNIEGSGAIMIQGNKWGINGAVSIGQHVKGFTSGGENGGVSGSLTIDENNNSFFSAHYISAKSYYMGVNINSNIADKSYLQYINETMEVVAYWDGQNKALTLFDGYGKDIVSNGKNDIKFDSSINVPVTVKIEGQVVLQNPGSVAMEKAQGNLTVQLAENASLTIKKSNSGITANGGVISVKQADNARLSIETDLIGISSDSNASFEGGSVVIKGMPDGIISGKGTVSLKSGHYEVRGNNTAITGKAIDIADGVTGYAYGGNSGTTANSLNNQSKDFKIRKIVTVSSEGGLQDAIKFANEQEETLIELTGNVVIRDITVSAKKDIVLTGGSMELLGTLVELKIAVKNGGKLTLEDIEVKGNNTGTMFRVTGTLVLGEGAVIKGSVNSKGIIVGNGGECIIDGGEISGNSFNGTALTADGGKIIMKKGAITNNESTGADSGGIDVYGNVGGQLLYYGGEISGNIRNNGENCDIFLNSEAKLQAASLLYTDGQSWKMYVNHNNLKEGTILTLAEGAEGYQITEKDLEGFGAMPDDIERIFYDSATKTLKIQGFIRAMTLMSPPDKVRYVEGERLDLTGLLLVVETNAQSDSVKYHNFEEYGITATPGHGDVLTRDDNKIIFTLGNKTVETDITVVENTVTGIDVKTAPYKINYVEGEALDLTGLELTVTMASGQNNISYGDLASYGITATPGHGELLTTDVNKVEFSCGGIKAEVEITVTQKTPPPTPGENVTVTFNSQGGSAIVGLTAEKGRMVKDPGAPVRDGYVFTGWYTDSSCTTAWNFAVDKVMDNIILYAGWKEEGGQPVTKHTITATVRGSGTITPTGMVTVEDSEDRKFTIKASEGFQIKEVLVNGINKGNISSYTFSNVKSDQTIEAVFEAISSPPARGGGDGGSDREIGPKLTTVIGPDGTITTTMVIASLIQGSMATVTVHRSNGEKLSQEAINKNADIVVIKMNNVSRPVTKAQISLPKNIGDKLTQGLIVETQLGNLGITPEALEGISKEDGSVLNVVLEKLFNWRYKVTFSIGGNVLNGLGRMTVTVPYVQKTVGSAVYVKIYNSDGSVSEIRDVYNEEKNEVSFSVDGSVEFSIEEEMTAGTGAAEESGEETAKGEEGGLFTDTKGHWAEDDIYYAVNNGLFAGVSEKEFGPDQPMTRGMFVTVLGRLAAAMNMEGDWLAPAATGFQDVPADAYYASYVSWAQETGIVQGISQELFGPDEKVTREQMAVMLYQLAKAMGYALDGQATEKFVDAGDISEWATEAVNAMAANGVISGRTDGRFDPKGEATRAEAAAMINQFVKRLAGM